MLDATSKFFLGGFGFILMFILCCWLFCFTMIPPGYVGVVINPLGDDGVQQKELSVGGHWLAPWKSVFKFPVFEQNTTWEGNDDAFHFQTSEGLAVSAEVGITYHLRPDCVPSIFQRYRRGMDEITNVFIHNFIRDAVNTSASKMKIEDLYGTGKEDFFKHVETHVKADLEPIGIEISRIYLIGRFHFPAGVIAALNSKIEATQRAQQRENELREAEAQAKKEIAKCEGAARCAILEAEAEAKANNVVAGSVTPALIEWEAIQKWDGKLPQVCGQATPFINLK